MKRPFAVMPAPVHQTHSTVMAMNSEMGSHHKTRKHH
jgi:hypothetical protein